MGQVPTTGRAAIWVILAILLAIGAIALVYWMFDSSVSSLY